MFNKLGIQNLKIVNILGISFNLNNNAYKPYKKADINRTYINKQNKSPT